ncbi:hypothetical protein EDO6_04804 [Paenibacillus xylanexedens]|nr:hypothetical protein EDO6_04804 [Paenibacillus xylanexedens]
MRGEWREVHISKKTNVADSTVDQYYSGQRVVDEGAVPDEQSIPNGIFYQG